MCLSSFCPLWRKASPQSASPKHERTKCNTASSIRGKWGHFPRQRKVQIDMNDISCWPSQSSHLQQRFSVPAHRAPAKLSQHRKMQTAMNKRVAVGAASRTTKMAAPVCNAACSCPSCRPRVVSARAQPSSAPSRVSAKAQRPSVRAAATAVAAQKVVKEVHDQADLNERCDDGRNLPHPHPQTHFVHRQQPECTVAWHFTGHCLLSSLKDLLQRERTFAESGLGCEYSHAKAPDRVLSDGLCRHGNITSHFPTALGVDDFMARLEVALSGFGFTGENSIGEPSAPSALRTGSRMRPWSSVIRALGVWCLEMCSHDQPVP